MTRRTGAAVCTALVSFVLSLAPLDVAPAVEKALASGNIAVAKRQMLKADDADLSNVTRALGVIKTANLDVRAAFKSLRTFLGEIGSDIRGARTAQQIVSELQTLDRDPRLQADGTTIAAWAASACSIAVPAPPGTG